MGQFQRFFQSTDTLIETKHYKKLNNYKNYDYGNYHTTRIKPFGFFYEYDKENDSHLIVSKRQLHLPFYSQYHKNESKGEHYNYLHAHMGANGGFRGFTRYGGNDAEFLIYCLTEEMNIRLISEHQMDTTFFIDAVTEEYNLHEMTG